MIGQNLQGKHAELLADNDFEVNKKAEEEEEEEIKQLKEKLDYLTAMVEKRLPEVKQIVCRINSKLNMEPLFN